MVTRKWILGLLGFMSGAFLYSQVEFANPTISTGNNLVFTATSGAPRFGNYTTGFIADASARSLTQLSFFPEKISILDPLAGRLQIQNRYGVFRTSSNFTGFEPVELYPSFVRGGEIQTGKINPLVTSPDGKWIVYLDRTSPAFGNLVLGNIETGQRFTVSNQVEIDLNSPPVAWSPLSDFFIYPKGSEIYYFSIDQYSTNRLLAEDYRSLGQGQLSSIYWGENNELYYISGALVYRALGIEFFTRSLYQEFLRVGTIVGTIPFTFDPNFDRFWISPDGTQLLLDRGGRSLYLYFLQSNDFAAEGAVIQLPYLLLPRNTTVDRVLWSEGGIITVLTQSLVAGEKTSTLYRLDVSTSQESYQFEPIEDSTVRDIFLSPQETRAAVLRSDRVEIRNYRTWAVERTLTHTEPLHALFLNEDQLILAGKQVTELVNVRANSSQFLFYSQLSQVGFSAGEEKVLGTRNGGFREYDFENRTWIESASGTALAPPSTSSSDFRIFLENLTSGSYRNIVMVRNVRQIGTLSLFDPPVTRYEAFPTRDTPISMNPFINGSRIRRREVSLVFNAIDSVEGLTTILNTLAEYDVRATFFVNGDFIRRHPGAVREIAASGHEVGNLFTVYFDMSDSRYQITSQFIQQGLARNEDEYFETTGRELSLLWHAPYYFTNPSILSAGSGMNYTYIGRDVDSLDWVPKRDETGISRLYYPSAELIESIIERKLPGSIVAMTVGRPGDDRPAGGRDDYLFTKLDILLNNLIERGYSIVPVSEIKDRAR
ncbi:MAG: polysaccharide deacetylase family protein [Spirochaetales bacterium]|nr:polysaccharide deacetylase family protein [Spirochaetales bacterium]